MRRVDRRTNALQTNRPTDTASYRGALAHLKSEGKIERKKESKKENIKRDRLGNKVKKHNQKR